MLRLRDKQFSARVVTRRRPALKLERIFQYDLFAVDPDNRPLWLETVNGLENAEKRMKERAAEEPGDYFIFNAREAAIVARLHTPRPRPARAGKISDKRKSSAG